MNILTRDEFKQLLNDNPTKRFLFLEWEPNVWLSDFHISSGDPKIPGFGASVWMADPNEDLIFDYDWNIDESYSSDDKFAVLSENEISQLIDIFRLCVCQKKNPTKKYEIFHVGGEPTKIAFLAEDLKRKLDSLQKDGWEIDSISKIDNSRAWDMSKQMYVSTPEYIIIAKKEDSDEVNEELLKTIGCPNPGYMLSSEEIHKALENKED